MRKAPESTVYEFCIQGHLSSQRARQFEGMTVTRLPDGVTTLVGPVSDQAALYCLLSRVRDLGTPLLSVRRLGPDGDRKEDDRKGIEKE